MVGPTQTFQHAIAAKQSENKCSEEGKNSFHLAATPLPQGSTAQCHDRPPGIVLLGKMSVVSAWLPYPCGTLPKGPSSFSPKLEC